MKKLLLLPAVAALAVTSDLTAQSLTASSNNPNWSNVNGTPANGGISSSSSNGGKTISLNWGQSSPSSSKKSSYTYAARTPDWAVADPTFFRIGTFTHRNYPVTGNVLDNVTLDISLTFEDALANTYTVNRSILIDHYETSNPAGDVVTFLNFGGPEVFTMGGYEYTFSFAGLFKYSNGTGLMNEFTTKESKCTWSWKGNCLSWDEKSTTGYLFASLDYRELPTSSVPEPSTYALMAAGLAGLAYARRRRSA